MEKLEGALEIEVRGKGVTNAHVPFICAVASTCKAPKSEISYVLFFFDFNPTALRLNHTKFALLDMTFLSCLCTLMIFSFLELCMFYPRSLPELAADPSLMCFEFCNHVSSAPEMESGLTLGLDTKPMAWPSGYQMAAQRRRSERSFMPLYSSWSSTWKPCGLGS